MSNHNAAPIKEFPDENFHGDPVSQARLDDRARWKRRQYLLCAWGVGAATVAMIIGGWADHDATVHWGWAGFAVFSIYALVLGALHPKLVCETCGQPFEKHWIKGEGEMEDLFLVCDSCKKTVFAHETRS